MNPVTDVFGTQTSAAAMAFGLQGVTDWSVQQPFLDVFKTARHWHAHTENQWGAIVGDALAEHGALDANGWITEMPEGVELIETFILTEMPAEATYTSGLYRLSYEGAGEITVSGAEIVSQGDGEIWFDYQATGHGMVTLSISATDPQNTGNYLRNIEVVKQEHIPAFEAGQIFNPLWLDIIDDAHALRFMDWMETNDSTLQHWSDRPQENDYTYHGGVPVEVMVQLANATGTDAWFNIPWNAGDTFIREFATYVRDNLDPDLRAHIELSNEVWNFMFQQAQDAIADSEDRFGRSIGDGWVQEYGVRSAEMAQILDEVFTGAEDQLVKVISTFTYWPGLENAILDAPAWQEMSSAHQAPYLSFDTYAVTGYFGASFGTGEKAGAVLGWIAESEALARQEAAANGLSGAAADAYFNEHRFDHAVDLSIRELRDGSITGNAEDSLTGLFEIFRYHKTVADAHGLDLVMYEGGSHIVGVGDLVNNETLTEFFIHLNYSEEMGQLYTELLDGWEAAGGTLFNTFVDVAGASQWGSWGSLRHLEDDTARHNAIVAFMDSHPAPAHMKDGIWNSQPNDYGPAPAPVPDDTPVDNTDLEPAPMPQPSPRPAPEPVPAPIPDPSPLPAPPHAPVPAPVPRPSPEPSPTSDDVREYVFGNSLYVWATGDPELSVSHWMTQMADAAGKTYATAAQTGMLTDHDDLPARPHIYVEGVAEAWDPDSNAEFADAGFNQITISPANFVQYQSPDQAYWSDPNTSPLEAALRIIDWAADNAPGATINIYETWPEMEGFASTFPPSDDAFANWRDYLSGDWHAWWVTLTEMIRDARPDLDIRLIDVGPKVMAMLDDPALGLSGLTATDLFQDDGPHGTPTMYLLSSMVHFTAIYGEVPPNTVPLPGTIHPAVAENLGAIAEWLEDRSHADTQGTIDIPSFDRARLPSTDEVRDDSGTVAETGTDTGEPDIMHGTRGNDILDGRGGAREIDGGTGLDTVMLDGHQAGYTLRFSGDTIVIKQRGSGPENTTTLRDIERLDFDTEIAAFGADGVELGLFDGMSHLDATSMEALTELYIAYFNRAPDAIGLYFWGDQMAQGMTLDHIAEAFFDQPETRALYGSLEDMPGFVTSVYQNVLGRDPDAAGLSYWLDILENRDAVTPTSFIQAILAGAKAETGGPGDAEYLANKVLLGGHFAITRGMSDVENANAVMQGFDGTAQSLREGIAQSNAAYETTIATDAGGFLMQLVGIDDTPFAF